MILIISNNGDTTTTKVAKYLVAMEKQFIRVHEDEIFQISVVNRRILLTGGRNRFFLDEITSTWFRRGKLKFKRLTFRNKSINSHMDETQKWLEDYVIKTLESQKCINKQSSNNVNKLIVLEKAERAGLIVPKYFLAENTDDVIVNETITKSITENVILDSVSKNTDGIIFTSLVEAKTKNNFFITFFQEKVEKDYEIRSFFLHGKIWSTAIISQNDELTKLDCRNYNYQKPNRKVPYKLTEDMENKIRLLMESLDLNCGSIDFIKSKEKLYFLEVNPIGQFLGLSEICNFYLEKEIAQYL